MNLLSSCQDDRFAKCLAVIIANSNNWFINCCIALSHQVTYTLFKAAAICTSCDCELEVLLKLILSTNVLPPSVDALNITLSFPVLLDPKVT
jgi:hypothetical protein